MASDPALGDVENQHRFAEHLIGKKLPRNLPSIAVPDDASAKARAIVGQLGLPGRKWAAVFVGGIVNVTVKSWPTDQFAGTRPTGFRKHARSPSS